jgi:hypothetical protein
MCKNNFFLFEIDINQKKNLLREVFFIKKRITMICSVDNKLGLIYNLYGNHIFKDKSLN